MDERITPHIVKTASVILKQARVLSAKGRKQIKKKNFALPVSAAESPAKGQKGSYPIHDIEHASNALARVSQHGTAEEQAEVRKKVYAKYPSLKKAAGRTPIPMLNPNKKAASFSLPIVKNAYAGNIQMPEHTIGGGLESQLILALHYLNANRRTGSAGAPRDLASYGKEPFGRMVWSDFDRGWVQLPKASEIASLFEAPGMIPAAPSSTDTSALFIPRPRFKPRLVTRKPRPQGLRTKKGSLQKIAGRQPAAPDATGPYGRGMGPGQGRADGSGLRLPGSNPGPVVERILMALGRGEALSDEDQKILNSYLVNSRRKQ